MESEWLGCGGEKKPGASRELLLGLYGWRRKCLTFTVCILIVIVSINLLMSLWILKILHFSQHGIGRLNINHGGIQLDGEAVAMKKLVASKITSRKSESLEIQSTKNISLISRNAASLKMGNKLVLSGNKMEVLASSINVSDNRGRLLFLSESNQVQVGAETLRVAGDGGAVFKGSLQTPLVRAESGQPIKLESPTRSLKMFALNGVEMESRAGDISATCFKDIKLQSKNDAIRLDVQNVYLPRVPTAFVTDMDELAVMSASHQSRPSLSQDPKQPKVFQVCICGKGRLFLAPPEGPCTADDDVCR